MNRGRARGIRKPDSSGKPSVPGPQAGWPARPQQNPNVAPMAQRPNTSRPAGSEISQLTEEGNRGLALGAGEGRRTTMRGGKTDVTTVVGPSGEGASLGPKKMFDPSMFGLGTRPDHAVNKVGEYGIPVQLSSNFFRLNCSKDWMLYQYSVSYHPNIDSKAARRGMIYSQKDKFGGVFIFDGSQLFTTKMLPEKKTEFVVEQKPDRDGNPRGNCKITVTLADELPVNDKVSLQLYNIIFRRVMTKLDLKQVGRNYYNPKNKVIINAGRGLNFEMWPGFQTSILRYETDIMLCSQVSHKLMRNNTVLEFFREVLFKCKQRGRNFKEALEAELIGQVVLTRYNNKTYKIEGVEWNTKVSDTFDTMTRDPSSKEFVKSKISYVEYYRKQYDLVIRDVKQPLLVTTPKKSDARKTITVIHLVPELCTLTGLTDDHRKDYQVMKKLAEHTKQGGQQVASAITNFVQSCSRNKEAQELLKSWGLSFEKELVRINARKHQPEKILFGGNRVVPGNNQASWDLRGQRLLRCVELSNWAFLYWTKDKEIAMNTRNCLAKVAGPMGFTIARPMEFELNERRTTGFFDAIKQAKRSKPNLQMVFVLLPSSSKEMYDALKTLLCTEIGVPSQMAVSKTLSNERRQMSVCTKIAIQMNVKLGGEAWAVNIPLKKTMIIGIDTYHDSSRRGRSIGGFVSSYNNNFSKWHSQPLFHNSGDEFLNALSPATKLAIENYKRRNDGAVPSQIFIYRDGVGDGQIDFVKNFEIPQISDALKSYGAGIKLTVIIVTKRINARFFKSDRGQLRNPEPGTVIDDTVTKYNRYDFFVVSQNVTQGTVTPTHFNVIHDECKLKVDHIQRLSYKLCHLYFNWNGTVRVPAPCLYAHKLAFLVGQSTHKDSNPNLADKLYYL